jgi:ribosomal protein S6
MKHYEFTYLTHPDMDETGAKNLQEKLAALVQNKQGTVADVPRAYKKRLAYRIKGQDAAYVNTILFTMEPAVIVDFKKETDAIAEILRGLIISYDPEKLKREPRRERPAMAGRVAAAEPEAEKALSFESKEAPATEAEAEKEEEVEAKEVKKEEEKPAKPKRRKIKVELRDIEEKLDEILK